MTELIKHVHFSQVRGVCSLDKTQLLYRMLLQARSNYSFWTQSGTVSFLRVLGLLYNSFALASTLKAQRKVTQVSPQDALNNVSCVHEHIKRIVSEVKQRHRTKETSENLPAVFITTLLSLKILDHPQ